MSQITPRALLPGERVFYPAVLVPKLKRYPCRRCEHCGNLLTPKVMSNKLETLSNFKVRKYCPGICQKVGVAKAQKQGWEKRRGSASEQVPETEVKVEVFQTAPAVEPRPPKAPRPTGAKPKKPRKPSGLPPIRGDKETSGKTPWPTRHDLITAHEYPPEVRAALVIFHKRYPGTPPHVASQDCGPRAGEYWLECLEKAGNIGKNAPPRESKV